MRTPPLKINAGQPVETVEAIPVIHREWSLIVNRWVRVIHVILARWKLPMTSVKVLLFLKLFQNNTEPSVIADFICVPRQTMTSILDHMEREGGITRTPHPSDRRKKCVRLSRKGRALSGRILAEIRRYEARAMAALDPDELRMMLKAMARYSEALEQCVTGAPTAEEALPAGLREGQE